jgi:hypothetical protein
VTHSLVLQAPFLIAAMVAVAGVAVVLLRHPNAALWLLAGAFVLTVGIVPPFELSVTQAGTTFYVLDLLCGLMFVIGMYWIVARPTPTPVSLPLLALSLLFVLHVAWGTASFGLQTAVHPSRLWLYVLGPLLYCTHARPFWSRSSFMPLLVGAGSLAAFALVQIGRNGLYGANAYIEIGGELVDARPVTSAGALLIVQCVLIALSAGFVRSLLWASLIVLLGTSVILLQHRTIWVVAVLAGAVAYIRWARVAIHVNERAAALAASAVFLVAPAALTFVGSSSAFADSVESATSSGGTFGWRTASWGSLIEAHSSPQDVFLGIPTGTSLERLIDGRKAQQSPHSLYVDALLSFGVLGPVCLIWIWFLIVRNRRRAAAVLGLSSVAVTLIVASQAVYGITNTLGPLQGVLLGVLLQAAWISSRGEPSEPPRAAAH